MLKFARSAFIAIVSGVVVGCKGDSTGTSLASIVATWTVTRADVISVANPATRLELVGGLGLTASLVLNANETFTLTSTFPGEQPDVETGTYTYTSGHLTLNPTNPSASDTFSFTLALSGNTMTLTGGTVSIDFGTGDQPATLNLTLTR